MNGTFSNKCDKERHILSFYCNFLSVIKYLLSVKSNRLVTLLKNYFLVISNALIKAQMLLHPELCLTLVRIIYLDGVQTEAGARC